ncbi:PTS system mannose-specific EIID component [bioreactor metagenome]|uniref:PTS system mannose-specific EIID component n=1 Tax=bioreactor metagenome TaxID=1076179 RepID=A0A645FTK4_9ZZZZ
MGDAFFFNCVRVIAAGIAIGLCSAGNILGSLIFVALYGGSQVVARYYLLRAGYSLGTSFIDKVFESGLMDALTKSASVLGMIMVGAMVAAQVNVKLAWTISVGGTSVVVLDILNSIMPGILSVALVFGLMKLIKKGWSPVKLVLMILVGAILLAIPGIF